MPPKRRKAEELDATTSESNTRERATRSSTRGHASSNEEPHDIDTTRKNSSTKSTKSRAKRNPKAASQPTDALKNENITTTSTTTNIAKEGGSKDYSIVSPLVKNPIPCHIYNASGPTTSSATTLIFTHGAGGTLSAPAIVNFCAGYSASLPILAFQGSMNLGARVKGFHACIQDLRGDEHEKKKESKENEGQNLILGGRSMGSRAAVIAATEILSSSSPHSSSQTPKSTLLVLVSYPLQGPKDVRSQILVDLPSSTQVLFVIGEKDSMCPLDLLEDVRKEMQAQSWLVVAEGLDHGMHGKRERELGELSGRVAAEWIKGERWDEDKWLRPGDV